MGRIHFADADKARVQITNTQARRIRKMYTDLSEEIAKEIASLELRGNVSSVIRRQYLEGLARQIDEELRQINHNQHTLIKKGMLDMATAVAKDSEKFVYSLGLDIRGAYSYIPSDIVREIASGNLYKGRWTLSGAIWQGNARIERDIDMIIAQGIAGQKSTYEIARDIEKYVNPAAKKDWQWSKVYPGTTKVIDYNAQRLARTMVSHAYQDSVLRTTKNNPFVECYEWLTSAGDRVCEICQERESGFHGVILHGKSMYGMYYAGDVPLDHPNGMCTIAPYVDDDYDAVADRLADWVNGEDDKELDKYARSLGWSSATLKSKVLK